MTEMIFLILVTFTALWALGWVCYLQAQVDAVRGRLSMVLDELAQLHHRLRVLDCQVAPQHWTDEAAKVYRSSPSSPRLYDDHCEPRPEIWP